MTDFVAPVRDGSHATSAPPWSLPLTPRWNVWKDLMLRGTGFAVELLEPLASAEASEALFALLDARDALESAFTAVRQETARIRPAGDTSALREWDRMRLALAKRRVPERYPPDARTTELVAWLRALAGKVGSRDATYRALLEAQLRTSREYLAAVVSRPEFQEAVIWQSPDLSDRLITRFPDAGKTSSEHEISRIVALRYLQRYTAKNDTIGFFGPVGWATVVEGAAGILQEPGPFLVARREVRFEYWAVDALIDALCRSPAVRRDVAPRIHPQLRLHGMALLGSTRPIPLTPLASRLLSQCDGIRTAREIVMSITGSTEGVGTREALAEIQALVKKRALIWRIPVPVDLFPEVRLRRELEGLPIRRTREQALASLDELEGARSKVAAARGNPQVMAQALKELDATFVRLTRRAARRSAGKMYAGRSLLHEDCVRDGRWRVGLGMLQSAGPVFDRLFEGASWYVNQVGARLKSELLREHARRRERSGRPAIPLARLLENIEERGRRIGQEVELELQQRWSAVLDEARRATGEGPGGPSLRVIEVTSSQLAGGTARAFPEQPLSWPNGRFMGPDLMIAAESPAAIAEGRGTLVIGEVHVGACYLLASLTRAMHPEPSRLDEQFGHERGGNLIHRAHDRRNPGIRVSHETRARDGFQIDHIDTPPWRTPDQVVRLADLVVREQGGELRLETRDGRHFWDLMEAVGAYVRHKIQNYHPWAKAPHRPRLVIDGVVVAREDWTFPLEDVPTRVAGSPAKGRNTEHWTETMITVSRWRRMHGMPRRVFVRIDGEKKPVLLDFESPYSVECLLRMSGPPEAPPTEPRTATFSEMLPDPTQCWLIDAAGQRYTSELRLVVTDAREWRSPLRR